MKKKHFAGILALAVCLVAASSAYAFGGFPGFQGNEAAMQALESRDYGAFVGAVTPNVPEALFNQMAERVEANAAVESALESADYAAWVQAIESMPRITDVITEANFADYVALYNARKSGDFETVRSLAEGLGVGQFNGLGINQAFPPRERAAGPSMERGLARNGFRSPVKEAAGSQ
jgi:hypothetical protein